MLENRKLNHLGLCTKEIDKTIEWYHNVLGFELFGDFIAEDGTICKFIRNKTGIIYELIVPTANDFNYTCFIEHIAYDSYCQ